MKYSVYIFDFDFTLADASPGIVGSVNYALSRMGMEEKSSDIIKKGIGMALKDAFISLTGICDEQLSKRFLEYFKIKADEIMTDNTVLFNDTISVLSSLKQSGCKTAIVSNKFRYRIDDILRNNNISGLIDHVVGSEDITEAKPSPGGLIKAATYLDAERSSVLYVGDSLIDANTAANASIDFAAVTTGTTSVDDFIKLPHVCIANSLTGVLCKVNSLYGNKKADRINPAKH